MMERTLPYSLEAEMAVLGSIILDPEAIYQVADLLSPEHFYRDSHQTIYTAALSLMQRNEPTELLLLSDELEQQDKLKQIGGSGYLSSLIESVGRLEHATYYAQIVKRKALFRASIGVCGEVAAKAYEEDESVFALAQERFFQIGRGETGHPISDHVDALERYREHLEALCEQNSKGVLTGVPTGYRLLNTLLGGFRASKLYILAARPGDGKTALALNFAYEGVKRGCQVLFFSIEMDEGELMQRLVAIESKVDAMHLRDAKFEPGEWERVKDGMQRLQQFPGKLWTDDTPANDISAMRAKARSAQSKHGLDMIIVDYLQLAKGGREYEHKAENRRLEVERVSRELKEMARELKVPVLALAQLNREVESRANRVPQLSDLREAGGIEQDCDVAMFLYRDPVIPKEAPEYDLSVLIEKHRGGPKGTVGLHFVGRHTRFYPLDVRPVGEEERA